MRRIQDHFPVYQRLQSASDAELLAAFRQRRDEASFREIVLRHGKLVQAATRQVLQNSTDVDDIVQATFLALLQRTTTIKRGESLGSWLYGVAHRLALQQRRTASRRQQREQRQAAKPLDDAARSAASAELQSVLAEAMQAIPERYRQAIIYCYLEERSPEEAAKLLGCPVGTLWSRLARGREKLRTILTRRGWNLEQPAMAVLLSAAAGSAEASGLLWQALQQSIQWQPHATLSSTLKPALAGLLFQEKMMFSLRSIMHVVVLFGLLSAGAVVGWNLLAQAHSEQPQQKPQTVAQIQPSPYPADWKGKLRGTITAADTGKPLAGATVCVRLIGVGEHFHLVYATSDADGRYVLPLPIGHAWLTDLFAPPGYYMQETSVSTSFVSQEGADAVFDFKLMPGTSWNIQLHAKPADSNKPPRFFTYLVAPTGSITSATRDFQQVLGDSNGNAVLTVRARGGRYQVVGYWPAAGGMDVPNALPGILEMEANFNPTQVVGQPETLANGEGQRITDSAGRTATIKDAQVVVEGKTATLRLVPAPVSKEPALILRGKVIDEQKQPIAGAEAVLAFHSDSGGAMSEFKATTNAAGEFQLPGLSRSDTRVTHPGTVSVMVRKKGYSGVESRKLDKNLIKETGTGDFGAMVLRPGLTLKGIVVDETGKPVQGAVVMNLTHYSLYDNLACRTDAAGRFAMPDLPPGKHQLTVLFGMQVGNATHLLTEKGDEVRVEVRNVPRSGRRESTETVSSVHQPTNVDWNQTPPRKEPKYQHEPRYALLVFGPNRDTPIWLVLDGEVLYVDRLGTGDLTAPECRISAREGLVKLGNPGFYKDTISFTFDVSQLNGTGKSQFQLDLLRRADGFVPKTEMDRRNSRQWQEHGWERGYLNRTSQYGKSAAHAVWFARRPAEAQVFNYDGPLQLRLKNGSNQVLERGPGGSDFPLYVGSVGKPAAHHDLPCFTQLALPEVPESVYLIARVTFPGKTPAAEPIVKQFELKQRCCGDTLHGTIIVPADAGPGIARVEVTTSPWPRNQVKTGRFEVAIEE